MAWVVTITEDGYLYMTDPKSFDKVSFPIELAFAILWNAANDNALFGASGPPQDKTIECPGCREELTWARPRSR